MPNKPHCPMKLLPDDWTICDTLGLILLLPFLFLLGLVALAGWF